MGGLTERGFGRPLDVADGGGLGGQRVTALQRSSNVHDFQQAVLAARRIRARQRAQIVDARIQPCQQVEHHRVAGAEAKHLVEAVFFGNDRREVIALIGKRETLGLFNSDSQGAISLSLERNSI